MGLAVEAVPVIFIRLWFIQKKSCTFVIPDRKIEKIKRERDTGLSGSLTYDSQ
jgi:hypothetical protein